MTPWPRTPALPPAIAVSGVKNSGKTTFLEGLIPVLAARGLQVGVIKHDGHDFTPDVPGTDSFRLAAAGAVGVAVYSARRWMMVRTAPISWQALLAQFAGFDLVLAEGLKDSPLPKIELVRAAVSTSSVCRPETLLALATDTTLCIPGVPSIGLRDYTAAADLLCGALGRRP